MRLSGRNVGLHDGLITPSFLGFYFVISRGSLRWSFCRTDRRREPPLECSSKRHHYVWENARIFPTRAEAADRQVGQPPVASRTPTCREKERSPTGFLRYDRDGLFTAPLAFSPSSTGAHFQHIFSLQFCTSLPIVSKICKLLGPIWACTALAMKWNTSTYRRADACIHLSRCLG